MYLCVWYVCMCGLVCVCLYVISVSMCVSACVVVCMWYGMCV